MNASLSAPEQALLGVANYARTAGYKFSPVTPLTNDRVNSRPENQWAKNLAGVLGWSRPFKRELLPRTLFELLCEAQAVEPTGDGWRSLIRISTLGRMYFLHGAYPTLAPDAVFFGPDTVRFVRAIQNHLTIARARIRRCVDIGCGAGPGAIAIAARAPDAECVMTDINDRALRFARINAVLNGAGNARAARGDILKDTPGEFDLIVSNPPYLIDPLARAYRHGGGGFGEGLSVEILRESLPRLSNGGSLLLYTGVAIVDGYDRFLEACAEPLSCGDYEWSYEEVDTDVFGEELLTAPYDAADRIAAVVLTASRKPK
jgi:SAM-dependent methyltransferase